MVHIDKERSMSTGVLPFGSAARNPLWPEARWNLTGLFEHDLLTLQVFSLLHKQFGCHLAFDSIHGAPQVPWNCGRIMATPVPTRAAAQAMVTTFNDVQIGVYFTFTNHLLERSDLAHPACNMLLESIDNGRGLNGVILASDLLYDYVRRRHPQLKLTASVVKVAEEHCRGDIAYYKSAQQQFDSVMLHPDDGFDYNLLDELDRGKIEILVNEDCAFRCPSRANDYQLMAMVMKGQIAGGSEIERTCTRKSYCRLPQARLTPAVRCCNFTTMEMIQVYEMGFRRFKLQGRQNMPATFLFDLLRFTVEPELIAPVIFKAFVSGRIARVANMAAMKVRADFRRKLRPGPPTTQPSPSAEIVTIPPMVVETPYLKDCRLPTGRAARHPCWPDAHWTIEGLSQNGRVLYDVMRLLVDRFDSHLNVDSVCDEFHVPWNGWPVSKGPKLSVNTMASIVRQFNDLNIGVSFACHEVHLTPADLDDEMGNRLLATLRQAPALNGVVVASDLLADYIRAQRPHLAITASAARTGQEGGRNPPEHYRALAERFDVVAVHPQDGFDLDLLEQLEPDRMEILVNDGSPWASRARGRPKNRTAANIRSRRFTTAELKNVYDLGYRRFRLQGRSRIRDIFLYDVLRYVLEPNLLLPVILKSITNAPERPEHYQASTNSLGE
jgi:hypothetical protein